MKYAFPGTKIAAPYETAKRFLLKDVKGFEKVRYAPLLQASASPSYIDVSQRFASLQ